MENGGRLPSSSSVSSVSMLEVKAETRLVLQAFLHRTANIPLTERHGRVGGAYRDHNKHRYRSKGREGWDSQAEELSSGDEKKNGFIGLIKQLPRRSIRSPRGPPRGKSMQQRDREDEQFSSDEEDSDKKKKMSRKKIKRQLTKFFKKRLDKEKDKERDQEKDKEKDKGKEREPCPPPPCTRPSTLPLGPPAAPENPTVIISPSHSPEFYEEVAERLEQIAYRSSTIKRPSPKPVIREPPVQEPPPRQPSPVYDKETMVQRLVDLITLEGDAINTKIESDPFLRSSLSRLSYASFAHLQDAVINNLRLCDVPAPPPDTSPTLRRIAVSMEVSRRIVTATGTQRLQGYAECYMETFVPWVKRQGGWENVVDLEDEYD